MKYQIGDIVLLLHSNEEGKVVEIINDKMMTVDVDGIAFPVYMDQVDFPYFKRFSEKKLFPEKNKTQFIDDLKKEKAGQQDKTVDGVWLSFLPVMKIDEFGEEIPSELKIHLINRTETDYQFIYKLHFFGQPDFELKNSLHPFEDFYLHDIFFADLNDSPSFEFDFSLPQPEKFKADHFETNIKLKPKQLFSKIKELREKGNATFSQLLFTTYPDKIIEDKIELSDKLKNKNKIYDATKAKQHLEPARHVIDLHIEELTSNWNRLTNFEMLTLQLKTFEKYYELALAHHQHSLIVIHGIGEGKLRDEIHELLRMKREVSSFVNQYHSRYGYGATEIFFKVS
jgi:hypothetical protein